MGALEGVGSKLRGDEIKQWLANPREWTEKAKAERKPPMTAFTSLSAEAQPRPPVRQEGGSTRPTMPQYYRAMAGEGPKPDLSEERVLAAC
jgi:hypothetical protein